MGQKLEPQVARKPLNMEILNNNETSEKFQNDLLQSFQIDLRSSDQQFHNQNIELSEAIVHVPDTKAKLQRVQKLIQFIGEIIYYCKLHMKKQHKFHYKISALLFYKYFYDKFRQLQKRYFALYQIREVTIEEYEKIVALAILIKDTFIKIKKWIHKQLPFLGDKIKGLLDQNSELYCFSRKEFFTDLLYPEVKELIQFYKKKTEGQFDEAQINICYVRMLKAILIIEELEYDNVVITMKNKDGLPDYEIDQVEVGTKQDIRSMLIESYKIFLNMDRP